MSGRSVRDSTEALIHALAPSGDGVGREVSGADAGRVVFVPRTAPGERIRLRVERAKKRHAHGSLLEILEPSPDRVPARCRYYDTCGGCQWQHVSPAAQLKAKQAIVARATGDPTVAVDSVGPPWGYRNRARLHHRNGQLGFHAARSGAVADIASCPLLSDALNEALPVARKTLETSWGHAQEVWLQAGCHGVHFGPIPHAGHPSVVHPVVREVQQADNEGIDISANNDPPLLIPPGGFAQAGAFANAALVRSVLQQIGAEPGRVVELYAGAGNFTRFVAERATTVVASDGDQRALQMGVRNVPKATWLPPGCLDEVEPPDTTLVDPPRAGLDALALGVIRKTRKRLVYVSCDPQTFARDRKRLEACGWVLAHARGLDLMPHTFHVEVVARFERE